MGPLGFAGDLTAATFIGVAFGFVLERSGFGDSRILAAQFYLHNMRVLKVMFTAIVTAMLLIFLSSAAGLLNYEALWVPPTHLWPGLVGGFLLGVGFIVGGFCPGTSMVATATLKLDGLIFVLGLMAGMAVFNAVAPDFLMFWQRSGDYGRVTLMDTLGTSSGVVAVLVVLMAVGAFAGATALERAFTARRRGRS